MSKPHLDHEAYAKIKLLLELAVDPRTPIEEARAAALNVCRRIEEIGLFKCLDYVISKMEEMEKLLPALEATLKHLQRGR